MMLTHGIPKLMRLSGEGPVEFAEILGMSAVVSLVLAIFAEVICSILVIVGLATRYAVIPLAITMMVVIFIVNGGEPFGERELPSLYLLGYIVLFVNGAGKYSLDKQLARKRRVLS